MFICFLSTKQEWWSIGELKVKLSRQISWGMTSDPFILRSMDSTLRFAVSFLHHRHWWSICINKDDLLLETGFNRFWTRLVRLWFTKLSNTLYLLTEMDHERRCRRNETTNRRVQSVDRGLNGLLALPLKSLPEYFRTTNTSPLFAKNLGSMWLILSEELQIINADVAELKNKSQSSIRGLGNEWIGGRALWNSFLNLSEQDCFAFDSPNQASRDRMSLSRSAFTSSPATFASFPIEPESNHGSAPHSASFRGSLLNVCCAMVELEGCIIPQWNNQFLLDRRRIEIEFRTNFFITSVSAAVRAHCSVPQGHHALRRSENNFDDTSENINGRPIKKCWVYLFPH
jgi:hypothetical protein